MIDRISEKAKKFRRTISPVREIMSYANPDYIRSIGIDPNELISFEVQFINNVRSVYKFQGTAIKNKVKVCEAEFSAMIIDKSSKEII